MRITWVQCAGVCVCMHVYIDKSKCIYMCVHLHVEEVYTGAYTHVCVPACWRSVYRCIYIYVQFCGYQRLTLNAFLNGFHFFLLREALSLNSKLQYNWAAFTWMLESELCSLGLCDKCFLCWSISSALLFILNSSYGS